ITSNSGGIGSGNGMVGYSVAPNPNPASRGGTITIGDQPFTVRQGAKFLDASPSHPFFDYINKLSAWGITTWCGGGNFCPDDPVGRGQMAAFLVRAFGL